MAIVLDEPNVIVLPTHCIRTCPKSISQSSICACCVGVCVGERGESHTDCCADKSSGCKSNERRAAPPCERENASPKRELALKFTSRRCCSLNLSHSFPKHREALLRRGRRRGGRQAFRLCKSRKHEQRVHAAPATGGHDDDGGGWAAGRSENGAQQLSLSVALSRGCLPGAESIVRFLLSQLSLLLR